MESLRLRLFRLKRISRNYFTPGCVFGTYRKLSQTEIIFLVDCKITLLARKTIFVLILPSNDLHFSHTLLKLLTHTPHRHHWYSPSSIVTELHPLSHAKLSSTLSLTPVWAPPIVRRALPIHPQWELIAPPHALTREKRSSTPHTDVGPKSPFTLAKPISPPTSPIHRSHVAGETLLSNPPSTIPDPPKIDLVLDPPKTDLVVAVEDQSRWPDLHLFPDLSLFPSISHSFFLPLSQFDRVQLVNEWS